MTVPPRFIAASERSVAGWLRAQAARRHGNVERYESCSPDWFDSAPDRDVANVLEDEEAIVLWVRLQFVLNEDVADSGGLVPPDDPMRHRL
jgi:hypothetical protein